MFDIELSDIKDIILILLVIGMIYLLFFKKNNEHFAIADDIRTAVNNQYKADIDSIRNLGQISSKIMTNTDNLTLPTNITIPGKLTVNGGINFVNKDSQMLELFPRYMIMAWYGPIPKPAWVQNSPPLGWAVCDGRRYIINTTTNVAEPVDINNSSGVLTPDLRGRFVIGAGPVQGNNINNSQTLFGQNSYDATWYGFGFDETGGSVNVTLTENQIPPHSHTYNKTNGASHAIYSGNDPAGITIDNAVETSRTGGGAPHNNMPPYRSLFYIMKI